MSIVRVVIWDEINFLQRVSTPEDTFLIESIDASGSDSNILKIGPLTASMVLVGSSNVATYISGVLSGNFITGTFYGDGSQIKGLVTTLNNLTGTITILSSSDFLKINSFSNGQIIVSGNHKYIDQLTHNISENFYEEFTYSGNNIMSATIYSSPAKTLKIREENFIYAENKILTSSFIQYDLQGIEVERLIQKYNYSGNTIVSVTGTLI